MTLELTDHPNPGLLQRAIRWLLPRAARFDLYDEGSRQTLFFAREAVSELGGGYIGPEHLLLGLLKGHSQVVRPFLNGNASVERLTSQLRDSLSNAERVTQRVAIPFSKSARRVLKKSIDEAGEAQARVVMPEHLLLGLLSEGARAAEILTANGVTAGDVRIRLKTQEE